ncbi:MAG: putative Integrase family protein [Acidimicrobiales bacterium]|nr:putative Integrase family protein [Acidimicrobiales bacterium]
MRGHVRRRGATWSFVIDVGRDPATGRRRQHTKGGFATKAAAEEAMRTALTGGPGGRSGAGKQRLADYLDEWLAMVEPRLQETTAASYRIAVARVQAGLGALRLRDLSPLVIERFYGELTRTGGRRRQGLSPKTVRNTHIVLRKALADAERLELLDRNPAARAKAPSADRSVSARTWTAAELSEFLAGVADDPLYALWVLLATTGLRRGEALGARWSDLDLARRTLSVRQTLTSIHHRLVFTAPKSDRSRRQLVLDPETVRVLEQHRERQRAEQALAGVKPDRGALIFSQPTGEPLHPDAITNRFQALMRLTDLPQMRGPHDLRHTWASLALASGVHPKAVSDRLGHSTIAITIDTYSHVIPALDADAAATVAAQLFNHPEEDQ